MQNKPDTKLSTNIAERAFIRKVQRYAAQSINNQHAGCTDDEVHFIRKYFWCNQAKRLHDAIIQCGCAVLETYRASELPQ
jgi:hypothetical protein